MVKDTEIIVKVFIKQVSAGHPSGYPKMHTKIYGPGFSGFHVNYVTPYNPLIAFLL
jgi:hypothetical protein